IKLQKGNTHSATTVNLLEVTQEVIQDLEQSITLAKAEVQTAIDSDLDLQFSKANLRSILYNLISNAIKYRSPHRDPIVRVSSEYNDPFIVIRVQDNGLGMDLSDQDVIFSMFRRLHDHVEGTGVGLFMVKRIIENAGGKIEVQSDPGKGSTFIVHLRKT